MSEPTVPESLIERIRAGRVALVVGAGVGVPSWRELLEAMNERLADEDEGESEGEGEGEGASKDVEGLLERGNLSRAAGFLARTLGAAICDELVVSTWKTPEELPAVAKALARQPFRHVWTTFPGDILETAMRTESPDEWPEPTVLTYQQAAEISPRRRTLVKILGDFSSYVVTPKSLRQALASADALRDYAREYYTAGTLIFVGFRYDDPDLAALLDRVFGVFELPEHDHFFVGSDLGPVVVEELQHEHHIQVIQLDGEGDADERLVGFLDALARACDEAGIDLSQKQPDDDDLEGWLAAWEDDPALARDALEAMEKAAREADDADRLIEILVGRVELESEPATRARVLRELADVFENKAGDLPRAFAALTTALREVPDDPSTLDEAERLAAETDGWTELISDVSEVAGELEDAALASTYWTRLGGWYAEHTNHPDYAIAAYRQAIKRDEASTRAYEGLEEVFRKQQRWADLADALSEHAQIETDTEKKIEIQLALGDLCENQLASTARAIEAYQASAALDDQNDDALAALRRLFRRDERWDKLVEVLERQAELLDAREEPGRATVIRREIASIHVDKLGDTDGAIERYEAIFQADESDLDALRALLGLYEKLGRTDEYLDTLERLIEASSDADKPTLLLRLAAEVEEKDGARAQAAYERVIELVGSGPAVNDAFRALERLHTRAEAWSELVEVYQRHIANVADRARQVELHGQMAAIYRQRLDDADGALACWLSVRELEPDDHRALDELAALYQERGEWAAAIDVLVRRAEVAEPVDAAPFWFQAGAIITDHVSDMVGDPGAESAHDEADAWRERAEKYLSKALELDSGHRDAMLALARLHQANARWTNAVDDLERAAEHTQNRLERVDILIRAADMAERELRDVERTLAFRRQVLEIDPEHVAVGRRVSERLLADENWREALPILEMLARKSESDTDKAEKLLTLGRVHETLEEHDRAIRAYRDAAAANPGDLDVALALGNARYLAAQRASNEDLPEEKLAESWGLVESGYRDLVTRFHSSLDDETTADLWHRIGVAARTLGANEKALEAFQRALEFDEHDRASLLGVVGVGKAVGQYDIVLDAKRALLDQAESDERVSLYTEMGNILHEHQNDAEGALAAYHRALEIAPESHTLLHRALEIYTETDQWDRAIDTLDTLAAHDDVARRRAKYRYTAAVIARDKLEDMDIAVDRFDLALDDDPTEERAFQSIDALLTESGDYKKLAHAFQRMLERLGPDAPVDKLLPLWSRLAAIYSEHLNDVESAIAAMEVVAAIEPDNQARHEALANLYLSAREDHSVEAVAELQLLLQHHPDRIELYRALSNLYTQSEQRDKAFCLARALVFLGAANDEEKAFFERHRPENLVVAERRITDDLWGVHIVHPDEDRQLTAILAALAGAIATTTARTVAEFDLRESDRSQVGRDARRVVARVFKYVSDILALDPEPHLYLDTEYEGMHVLNTREGKSLVPSVVVGEPHASMKDDRVLAFEVGKRLAYLRPGPYTNYILDSLAELESTYQAILAVSGLEPDGIGSDARKMARHLEKTVPSAVLDQVRAATERMVESGRKNPIARWRAATEMTANRVGLLLCNDLEIAARLIATDSTAMTTLSTRDRLRDLLGYSVSEPYFQMREHLCLGIRDP